MRQAQFKKQQENPHINPVIIRHLGGRHNSPLSRLLIPVYGQFVFLCHNLPGLRIAGAWRKSYNIANLLITVSFPYLFQGFPFALKHILPEFAFLHSAIAIIITKSSPL